MRIDDSRELNKSNYRMPAVAVNAAQKPASPIHIK